MLMRTTRYLSILVMLLLCSITMHGQSDFNPNSPGEPDMPSFKVQLALKALPSEGGSVSGACWDYEGKNIYVSASASTNYQFSHWTNQAGETVSTDRVFYYTMGSTGETLTAHFTFLPSSPQEPNEPKTLLYFRVTSVADVGGSVSGGGRYQMGSKVNLNASPSTGYYFTNWTDENGTVVSTKSSFTYTVEDHHTTLTAHFVFDPSAPAEPSDPILRHAVTTSCGEGGTTSGYNGRYLEGSSLSFNAYSNTGYDFVGWYLNGEFYTALRSFSYTIGKERADFYALFNFNPSSPREPDRPALDQYSFYLMTKNAVPGGHIDYPMYLTSTDPVLDMVFNLTFPSQMMPDLSQVTVSAEAVGYEVSYTALNDSVFTFSLIGGRTEPCTTLFLSFPVEVSEEIKPGSSWQVKINQVSVVQEDGTTVTTRTRNGRMGVYQWGDASMDGVVDVVDSRLVINDYLGTGQEELDYHVADIVQDGALDVQDSRAIINVYLQSSSQANAPARRESNRNKKPIVL